LEVKQVNIEVFLSQNKHEKKILHKFYMEDGKSNDTAMNLVGKDNSRIFPVKKRIIHESNWFIGVSCYTT